MIEKKFSDFQEVLNEDKMNNNVEDEAEQNEEPEDDEDVIKSSDFNEEDFDEGPGPGLYIPQATITKL